MVLCFSQWKRSIPSPVCATIFLPDQSLALLVCSAGQPHARANPKAERQDNDSTQHKQRSSCELVRYAPFRTDTHEVDLRSEAGDTSSASTLSGKFRKVAALEYVNWTCERSHQSSPKSTRASAASSLFCYGSGTERTRLNLEPKVQMNYALTLQQSTYCADTPGGPRAQLNYMGWSGAHGVCFWTTSSRRTILITIIMGGMRWGGSGCADVRAKSLASILSDKLFVVKKECGEKQQMNPSEGREK